MSSIRFHALNIRRLPGISDGFRLDEMASGVNVVFGPNASGKSSTARAIETLLWPTPYPTPSTWLEAHFEVGEQRWQVELDAGHLRFDRNGEPASSPNGLPREARSRYKFPLHELLSVDDRELARAIALESAGGYDLTAAAKILSPRTTASRPRREIEEVKAARRRLREARAVQDLLQTDTATLKADEARIAAKGSVEARLEVAKLVLQRAERRRDFDEATERLTGFPAVLPRLAGDEVMRLQGLKSKLDEALQKERSSAEGVRQALASLTRLKASPALLQGDCLQSLIGDVTELERIELEIRAEDRAVEQAREQIRVESGRLTPLVEADLEQAILADVNEVAAAGAQLQEARAQRLGLEAELRTLPEFMEVSDPARLEKAAFLLQQWLRAPEPVGGDRLVRMVAIGLSAALLVGGALLAVLHPLAIALSAAGALLLTIVLKRPGHGPDPRRLYEGEFAELGSPEAPATWRPDNVRACLDLIYDRIVAIRAAAEAFARRQRLEADLALAVDSEGKIREMMTEAAAQLGLSNVEHHSVPWILERISRWLDARAELTRANAKRVTAFGHRSAALDLANERLASIAEEPVPDAITLAARVRKLDERVRAHTIAEAGLRQSEGLLATAGARAAEVRGEITALFDRLGITAEDEPRLADWCAMRGDYLAARQQVDTLASEAARLEARLRAAPAFDETLLCADPYQAEQQVKALINEIGLLDELQKRVIALRTNVERAMRGHEIEDAIAEVERTEGALRAVRDRDGRSALAAALVSYVERVSRNQQRPEVFHRASALFTSITRGRYELRLEEGDLPAFRAFDTQRERLQPLDELSSATRVQLLIAVRVAFVEVQEGGVRLPLLLDETLGNSDDDRASAIMEAIAALAAEGRQIFYFTAQVDEVRKWRSLLASRTDIEGKVFDLGEIRRLSRRVDPALLQILAEPPPRLPDPLRMTHGAYGELLDVPAIDPLAPLGSLHLWYLVEEPRALYQLLTDAGAQDWGGLRSFIDLAGDRVVLPPVVRRIEALAAAADAALVRLRVGVTRKVDRYALVSSRCISEKFFEPVMDLCRALDGDARALIAALDDRLVPRFLERNIGTLREYFEENGYLDERTPLPSNRIRQEVLEECAGSIKMGVLRVAEIDRLLGRLGVAQFRRSISRNLETEPDFWATVPE